MRTPKLAELVAHDVRRRIVLGELGVDDTLPPEPALISHYGISRNVVREALRILESESLIELRRGSRNGARVRAPDVRLAARYFGLVLQWQGSTLGDVVHARVLLESAAVRELVLTADRDQSLTILREWIDRAASGVADFRRFGALARAFSKTLVRLTGNDTILLQFEMIEDMIDRHVARVEARLGGDPERGIRANQLAVRAMERLIELIELGDEQLAENYWREHLVAVTATLAEGLDRAAVVDVLESP